MASTQTSARCRVVVLISGRGSNLRSLIDQALHYDIIGVFSDRADAPGLQIAAQAGIPTQAVVAQADEPADAYDNRLRAAMEPMQPQLVCLAGFMRILSHDFVTHFAGRLLNIHPSLLPKYRGLHTHRRALAAGDKEHGASVHFVTAELDGGPVIAQTRLEILPDETESQLAERLLPLEHQLYPQVVNWYAQQRLCWHDGEVTFDTRLLTQPISFSPA